MRFIGSKERLLDFIENVVEYKTTKEDKVFCDIFGGTGAVGKHFKKNGYKVIGNDKLFFSYVLQYVYLKLNEFPSFNGLNYIIEDYNINKKYNKSSLISNNKKKKSRIILDYLNSLEIKPGFFHKSYSPAGPKERMYFTEKNAAKIDAIRNKIEEWYKNNNINKDEYYFLICSLIESIPYVSNIAGVYGAYLKEWDKRAFKDLMLELPQIIKSNYNCTVYNADGKEVIKNIECDILYIDPPYNSRQYITNYHILETVARWDNPDIYGVTGLRPYGKQEKSMFCYKNKASNAFKKIVENANCNYILLSYNSEGIIPHKIIMDILSIKGDVEVFDKNYRRYKSDSNSSKRNYKKDNKVKELIYFCETNI